MAWAFLYVAFGIVALWLGGEVLFQYKARLRWRALAFGGFLLVVVGAVVPSIVVIVIGIAAFATGQTFVTLSHRRGFTTGWALGGGPGTSRRRRGGQRDEFEEYDPEEDGAAPAGDPYGAESAAEQTMVAPAYDPADYQPDDVFTPGGYPTQTFPPADFADAPAPGYDQGFDQAGYEQAGYEQDGYQGGYGYPRPAYDTGAYEQTAYAGAGTDPYGYADPYGGYQGDGFGAQPQQQPPQPEPAPVYQPGPLPGETGEFVAFTGQGGQPMYGTPGGPPPQQPGYGDPYAYGGYEQPYDPAAGYGYDQGGYDPGYGGQQPGAGDPWVPQQRADGTHPQQQPGYDHQGYYYEGY